MCKESDKWLTGMALYSQQLSQASNSSDSKDKSMNLTCRWECQVLDHPIVVKYGTIRILKMCRVLYMLVRDMKLLCVKVTAHANLQSTCRPVLFSLSRSAQDTLYYLFLHMYSYGEGSSQTARGLSGTGKSKRPYVTVEPCAPAGFSGGGFACG